MLFAIYFCQPQLYPSLPWGSISIKRPRYHRPTDRGQCVVQHTIAKYTRASLAFGKRGEFLSLTAPCSPGNVFTSLLLSLVIAINTHNAHAAWLECLCVSVVSNSDKRSNNYYFGRLYAIQWTRDVGMAKMGRRGTTKAIAIA